MSRMVIWYISCQILFQDEDKKREMMRIESQQINPDMLNGRNRRLWHEWNQLEKGLADRRDISIQVTRRNADSLPTGYLVNYHLRSICGVEHENELNEPGVVNTPVFATGFQMMIELPQGYPCVDAPPSLYFLTADSAGESIPHPWHPDARTGYSPSRLP